MAFALQRRGISNSRHNWNDDVQWLLKWIENARVTGLLDMEDPLNEGRMLVEGNIDLANINRMRKILGWVELEEEKPE